jgi:hypothetical protein
MAIPVGTLGLPQLSAKPSAPAVGSVIIYTRSDGVLYLQDSSGSEFEFGSVDFISALTGDVSAVGPGSATATVNFVGGLSASAVASGSILANAATSAGTPSTIVLRDGSGNFVANIITATLNGSATNFSGSLLGDVTGMQNATVVSFVGGSTAGNVHLAEQAVNAATSTNIPNTIVKRDASGNFAANIITATLAGVASSFSGSLVGDVTGTQGATVVSFIDGVSAAAVASGSELANNATSSNTPSTIVLRDSSGNFSANVISSNLTGNVTGSSASFTGSLSGDVTGTQSATTIASTIVTGKTLTGYISGTNTPITSADTILSALEKLQAQISTSSGSAITALTGDVSAVGPGSATATIQPHVVNNSKLAQMPANTIKGNNTGATANATDLTVAQVTAMLNSFTGDTGSGGLQGLVPAPGAGNKAAGDFLSANGTWAYVDQSKPIYAPFSFVGITPWTGAINAKFGNLATYTGIDGHKQYAAVFLDLEVALYLFGISQTQQFQYCVHT